MIKAEDIYKVTNNGLDIILHYYPQARDCVGTNRHFKPPAVRGRRVGLYQVIRKKRFPSRFIR